MLSATCLFLSVWGLTPLLAKVVSLLRIYLGAITSAFFRSFQTTDSFPTWSVVGLRQVTSQCAFGQLSVVHSRLAGQKEE